jgi:fatty acid desaturase
MELHPEELGLARAYERLRPFEALTTDQVHLIMERGRTFFRWYKAHPYIHNLIGLSVLLSILAADGWALLRLPRFFLTTDGPNGAASTLSAAIAAGALHSWLMYSLVVYSLHEGAAHNAIFSGTGIFARAGQFVARHIGRLAHAEPDHYSACHMAHHAKFGTEQDSEFLSFVLPHRLWMTFLPYAVTINYTDFLAHRPLTYTRSRIVSAVVALTYNGTYGWLIYRSFGLPLMLWVMLVVFPHVGFYLDRLRQFTEHNLMPLENRAGARSFGVGFWGLLIGGGPWGQPCHLVHHIVASIPWYQQILLHRYMKALLTPRQREQFVLTPVIGYPRLLAQVVRNANAFAREQHVAVAGGRTGTRGSTGRRDRDVNPD